MTNPQRPDPSAEASDLRARVLRLLDDADAGRSPNWRDTDEGYWIGVAEGSFDAEARADRAERLLADERAEREAFLAAPCKTCGHPAGSHSQGVELPVGCTVIGCGCGRAAVSPDAEGKP